MGLVLLVTSVVFYISLGFFLKRSRNNLHAQLSSTTMAVAGTLYLGMGIAVIQEIDISLRLIRYLDWFITVPIMVYQMFLFLHERKKISNYFGAILCVVGMLTAGLLGEYGVWNKTYLGVIGILLAFYTFIVMCNDIKKEDYKFFTTVLILWLFYPVVYYIPESIYTVVGYSIVDVLAKVGSSLYVKNKIKAYV